MGLNKKIEHILFNRAREGEEDSFEILFNHYYSKLCTYATIFVKYPDVAEEIVQETFIRVWEKRSDIIIESTFKAYIYRSVHNNCINYLKSNKYIRDKQEAARIEISRQFEVNIKNLDTGIIDQLISEEFNLRFARAIESLPEQCRKVFLLCRNEQLTYTETAERLNISTNTVKSHMKTALMKLKEFMDKDLKK